MGQSFVYSKLKKMSGALHEVDAALLNLFFIKEAFLQDVKSPNR